MPKLVASIRAAVLAQYPTAVVHERGQSHIKHRVPRPDHPDGDLYVLDSAIGAYHYHDGTDWQEIDTDWKASAVSGFTDGNTTSHFHVHSDANGKRRVYPRRDHQDEYIEFGRIQYWTGSAWSNLTLGTRTVAADLISWDRPAFHIDVRHQGSRIKFDLTLKTAAAAKRVRWAVSLTGLTMSGWNVMAGSEVVAEVMPFTMVDAAGTERAITATYSGGFLEFTADVNGLVYPVVVDPTLDVKVGATANDGYTYGSSAFYTTNSYLYMGHQGVNQTSGFVRFDSGITVPQGATVSVCYVGGRAFGTDSGTTTNLNCYFADADNQAAPTSYATYNAIPCTAAVDWSAVPTWTFPTIYNSPDLSTIAQAVFARAGWSSGNALVCLIKDNGSSNSASRRWNDYTGTATYCVAIHIEYTTGGGVVNASVTQVAATLTATGGTQSVAAVRMSAVSQVAGTLTATGGTQAVVAKGPSVAITQVAGTLTATGGTQTVASVQVASAAVSQVAAVLTATGGTQTVATVRIASVAQATAALTATGGTQAVASVQIAVVAQSAATVTATGGTQAVATVRIASVAQAAATLTATGGTQTLASVQNASLAQTAATITAAGGTQAVASIRIASVTQAAAALTATGGTQTVASVQAVAIAQAAATLTVTGGTQVLGSSVSAAIAQISGTLTATGGTQTVASAQFASLTQVAAPLTATGGTQAVAATEAAQSVAIAQISASLTVTGGVPVIFSGMSASVTQTAATLTATGGTQGIASAQVAAVAQLAAALTATGGTQQIASAQCAAIVQIAAAILCNVGSVVVSTVRISDIDYLFVCPVRARSLPVLERDFTSLCSPRPRSLLPTEREQELTVPSRTRAFTVRGDHD